MLGSDETELRLVRRGKWLCPDRNYDYFVLKRLMFTAGISQFNGIRLLEDSDQYERIQDVIGDKTICITGEPDDASNL
jgi:hypothetical protein